LIMSVSFGLTVVFLYGSTEADASGTRRMTQLVFAP
jgi:hypothetical protein